MIPRGRARWAKTERAQWSRDHQTNNTVLPPPSPSSLFGENDPFYSLPPLLLLLFSSPSRHRHRRRRSSSQRTPDKRRCRCHCHRHRHRPAYLVTQRYSVIVISWDKSWVGSMDGCILPPFQAGTLDALRIHRKEKKEEEERAREGGESERKLR